MGNTWLANVSDREDTESMGFLSKRLPLSGWNGPAHRDIRCREPEGSQQNKKMGEKGAVRTFPEDKSTESEGVDRYFIPHSSSPRQREFAGTPLRHLLRSFPKHRSSVFRRPSQRWSGGPFGARSLRLPVISARGEQRSLFQKRGPWVNFTFREVVLIRESSAGFPIDVRYSRVVFDPGSLNVTVR